tara:strand:- start:589 stop:957 length:369 start_codon:yes stop_codon:yes gene_type:complete
MKTKKIKISAKEIKKGMTIKVASIYDSTQSLLNMINDVKGWGTHTLEEKKGYQASLDNNDVLNISRGAIKKDSPTLKVYDIDFDNSYSYQSNGRLVTINTILLKTDKGNISITTRQKVEIVK